MVFVICVNVSNTNNVRDSQRVGRGREPARWQQCYLSMSGFWCLKGTLEIAKRWDEDVKAFLHLLF